MTVDHPGAGDAPPSPARVPDDLTVYGVSLGHGDHAAAEHWLATLPFIPVLACTHLVAEPYPHVALSLALPPEALPPGALPPGALPPGALPPEALPPGALPPGALPPEALPPEAPPDTVGDAALRVAADVAAAAHRARRSGRAVLFPGVEHLVGVLSVAQILQLSAIERVCVLGSADLPAPTALVDTRDHVRPQWMDGVLTLVTTPSAGGRIAPFEVPAPTPCCAAH